MRKLHLGETSFQLVRKPVEKLHVLLKKNVYLLAALIFPLLVRSVPEVLSWPYPLGLDTLRYVPLIRDGWVFSLGPVGFLKSTNMFYLIASVPNWLLDNSLLAIKVLGPLLLGALSVVMFLYAKRVLKWSNQKSLLVSILVSTYFVSLRISWDLYRQTLGFVFLITAFIALKSLSSPRKYLAASILMTLTVLSHELASVTLLFVLAVEALRYLWKRQKRSFASLLATAGLPVALFLFQIYSSARGTVVIPLIHAASESSLSFALEVFGFMIYCYILILPLALMGLSRLKDSFLWCLLALCMAVPTIAVFFPSSSLPYWNRWIYILVYPLMVFATEGFDRLWGIWSRARGKLRHLTPKLFAVVYLFLLLTLSGFYISASPEHSLPYFSQYNPYLNFIPSSMLQTTVSIDDTSSLIDCFNWLNKNMNDQAVVVCHYALYDWAEIYLNNKKIVSTPAEMLSSDIQSKTPQTDFLINAANASLASGHSEVFTVWWVNGKGWFQIPTLPAEFEEVYCSGKMAVYSYHSLT
jgi:hypothetical protein